MVKKGRHLIEFSHAKVIIQTDHLAILDILQQSSITSTSSIIRLNLRLIRASQFLQQFKFDVRHKPGKEHIIPDALSWLASSNIGTAEPFYLELDALCLYNTTLIEIHPTLVSRIIASYNVDAWWSWLPTQVQTNKDLGIDKASFFFMLGSTPPTNADPYHTPRPEGKAKILPAPKVSTSFKKTPQPDNTDGLPSPDKAKLLYHVSKMTGVYRLCIPPSVALNILAIAHGEGHPDFSRCYEIITQSWFIWGLTKLLRTFICHYPQCLALQTRRHALYGSL